MHFTVEVIPHDEAGVRFFVATYKPFRLRALATDPSCFGSNYAREAAFTDRQWEERILNPLATTFVAVSGQGAARQILSSTTLVGPVPIPSDAVVAVPGGKLHSKGANAPLHWAVNGVYTAPEARRHGIARQVMAAALRHARSTASSEGRDCLLTVLVATGNEGASALYEKAGFVFSNEKVEGQRRDIQLCLFYPREGTA